MSHLSILSHSTANPNLTHKPNVNYELTLSFRCEPYQLGKLNSLVHLTFYSRNIKLLLFPIGPSSHFNRTPTTSRHTLRHRYFSLNCYSNRLVLGVKHNFFFASSLNALPNSTRWLLTQILFFTSLFLQSHPSLQNASLYTWSKQLILTKFLLQQDSLLEWGSYKLSCAQRSYDEGI